MELHLLPELDAYIRTQFARPDEPRKIWRTPLRTVLTGGHVPFDCTPGQFIALERKCYNELLRRTSIIPPRKHRGAGKCQVMLACHLAEECNIPEAVANRIIISCYEFQEKEAPHKNPPISDPGSFRVTKMRLVPAN